LSENAPPSDENDEESLVEVDSDTIPIRKKASNLTSFKRMSTLQQRIARFISMDRFSDDQIASICNCQPKTVELMRRNPLVVKKVQLLKTQQILFAVENREEMDKLQRKGLKILGVLTDVALDKKSKMPFSERRQVAVTTLDRHPGAQFVKRQATHTTQDVRIFDTRAIRGLVEAQLAIESDENRMIDVTPQETVEPEEETANESTVDDRQCGLDVRSPDKEGG